MGKVRILPMIQAGALSGISNNAVLLIRAGSWHKLGDELKLVIEAGQLTENQISGNLRSRRQRSISPTNSCAK